MAIDVLVVDDDPSARQLASMVLSTIGLDVATAENGKAALEAVESHRPAMIVLDLSMPIMDGWTCFRKLEEAGDRPHVLITSALDAGKAMRQLGAEGSLAKPYDPEELIDKVESPLD